MENPIKVDGGTTIFGNIQILACPLKMESWKTI